MCLDVLRSGSFMKNNVTKEYWKNFVSVNSLNTYNMIVAFLILQLWEMGVETKEDASKALHEMPEAKNITGFQADMIIAKAVGNKPEWNFNDEE